MKKFLLSLTAIIVFAAAATPLLAEQGNDHESSWSKVQEVSDGEFDAAIAKGISVVYFYADWCGPCRQFGPIFKEFSSELNDEAKALKVNIDLAKDTTKKQSIKSIPTIVLFRDGQELKRLTGTQSKQTLWGLVHYAQEQK